MATKPYADYAYYTGTFNGKLIPEASFPQLARRASALADYLAFGRIEKHDESDLPDAVKDAVCAAAEILKADDDKRAALLAKTQGGVLKSENIDGYSVSFGNSDTSAELANKSAAEQEAYDEIRKYLMNTGLLFRGFSRKWDSVEEE